MSESLGLLQNLVSASDITKDADDYDGSSNFFSFKDFEQDLDFINQNLEDEDQTHEADESKDEQEVNCVTYENSEDKLEVQPYKKEVDEEYEESLSVKEKLSKKVSFDLPDILEYSDDFESSSEEQEEKDPNKFCRVLCEEGKIHDIDHKPSNSQVCNESDTTSEVKACSSCNCRLTRMHILDLTDLNNLFFTPGIRDERKLMRKRTPGRRKNTKDGLNRCDKKADIIDKNGDDMKQKKKPPLETFWPKSSNSSLLSWLKIKKKEERIKRSTKRKEKKEEKLVKRQEELAKLDRKEISDKKVLEWMKRKRKEKKLGKLFEGKVTPVNDDYLLKDSSAAPNGYSIVDSFEMKKLEEPKLEEKEKVKSSDKRKLVTRAKKSQHREATKSPSEDGKSQSRSGTRKSYDEWLKEKKSSFIVDKTKHANKTVNDDDKIYVKERIRRHEIKSTYRQKVDSNLTLKLKRATNENSSSNQHKLEQAKDRPQQYRWAYKLSNPAFRETSKLKPHNDVSLHNSIEKECSKGAVSNTKIVGSLLKNGSDVTNTMRNTKLEEVS